MTSTNPAGSIPFDPELLQTYAIVRRSPAWKEVKQSIGRLQELLRPDPRPYPQMETDRDNVLRFMKLMRESAEAIVYGICLAAHLGRFSANKAFEQRLTDGFRALSDGLGLAELTDDETRNELTRCAREAFGNLLQQVDFAALRDYAPPGPPPPEGASDNADTAGASQASVPNPWIDALDGSLALVANLPPIDIDQIVSRAENQWVERFVGFLQSPQRIVAADIDFLRCRARNLLLGTLLPARLLKGTTTPQSNVSQQQWNVAFIAGLIKNFDARPLFAYAALGALGFDVPRLSTNLPGSPEQELVDQIPATSNPRKGLLILRVTADSQTADWPISPEKPAIIMTAGDFMRPWKLDLLAWLRQRLDFTVIEVARGQQISDAARAPDVSAVIDRLEGLPIGYLLAEIPANLPQPYPKYTVSPADAWSAFQALNSSSAAGG